MADAEGHGEDLANRQPFRDVPAIGEPVPISVHVVCRDHADHEALRSIREGIHRCTEPTFGAPVARVNRATLDGVRPLCEATSHPIVLIAPEALRVVVLERIGKNLADIYTIFHARSADLPEFPLASHSRGTAVVAAVHLIDAVRKAVISLRTRRVFSIRPILTPAEFEAYFALRFAVWRQLNYIPTERVSPETGWEVDYTDRTSFPVGAFSGDAMIGCARLVGPLGSETPCAQVVRDLLSKRGDPILLRNFEYPRFLTHPFDMLQSFPAFQIYYKDLVMRRIRKAELSRVIVRPDYRRRGVGELLVDTIIAIARANHIQRVFLACAESNATFYKRSGFRVLADMRTDRFVNVNAPAIAMERTVGAEK